MSDFNVVKSEFPSVMIEFFIVLIEFESVMIVFRPYERNSCIGSEFMVNEHLHY